MRAQGKEGTFIEETPETGGLTSLPSPTDKNHSLLTISMSALILNFLQTNTQTRSLGDFTSVNFYKTKDAHCGGVYS